MYKDISGNLEKFDLSYPETVVPNPKDSDYNIGFIRRFFLRKANDQNAHIFEVNQTIYSKYIKNPFWIGDSVKWRIAGPLQATFNSNGQLEDKGIVESNKSGIAEVEKNLPNLKLYLPNLLQFYKK